MTPDRFTTLYKKYGPAIYSRCRRLLGSSDMARDATQEVFLRVAIHLDKTPTSVEALMWIYRVATNYCFNDLRNQKRRPRVTALLKPEERGFDSEALMANRDLVRRIIERVPERLRASAWLYHVDGMTHEEVGRTLGCSRRTVINRVDEFTRRAREFLARES